MNCQRIVNVPNSGVRSHHPGVGVVKALSLAFLVLLESLGPVERAVFLREVIGYGYDEIAGVVGKSEDNCRQFAARARRQVEAKKPRFEASLQKREELSR